MSHNLEGSMLSDSSSSRRKKRGWVDDMMEAENTPGDVIHQWSPTHKQLCLHPREKENDAVPFVLSRRSRRRKETSSGLSWDHLPDELILRILFCLPLSHLLRTSLVCKRWRRLAFDESLWHSVDLDGVTNMAAALELLLTAGVRRLRCPRTFIQDLQFVNMRQGCKLVNQHPVHVVQMDLSNCNISAETLEVMLSRCSALTHLSLEGLELSDRILHHLSQNPEMIELNMGGCAGFSPEPLGRMLQSFSNDVGEKFTALRLLDAFGLIPDPRVFSKTYEIKHIAVNTRAISMIARPTPVLTDVHSMWDYRCRLRFHY
ncbi:unnamed protein product [Merluccius merluccius]